MEPFVAFVTLDHLLRLIRASADAVELDLVRVIGCHNHGLLALDGLDNWRLLSIFLDGWIQNGRHFFEGFWLFLSALLGLGLPIPGGRVLLLGFVELLLEALLELVFEHIVGVDVIFGEIICKI